MIRSLVLCLGAAVLGVPTALLAGWTVMVWRGQARTRTVEGMPEVPVAVVLGAQMHPGGRPSNYLQGRLNLALALYRAGKVQRFITSGDDSAASNHESTQMARYLIRHGVPAAAVTVDPGGFDTYDSCRRARDVYGEHRLVVVSQTFHLPRALTICRWLGLDAWAVADNSVRHLNEGRNWRWGYLREVVAQLKLAVDLLTDRPPRLT